MLRRGVCFDQHADVSAKRPCRLGLLDQRFLPAKLLAGGAEGLIMCAAVNGKSLPAQLIERFKRRAGLWLLAGAVAAPVMLSRAEEYYIVKRGDTLYGIAQHYGVAPDALAERNGLSRSFHVYAGQRLLVPGTAKRPGATSAPAPGVLPWTIQRALDHAKVQPGRWKYIVIHHSGVDTGTVSSMDHYHRDIKHMENGLAYHFVIGNGSGMGNGAIAVCPRWTKQLDGGHLASDAQNAVALGICLVGNFDAHPPNARQMESLHALIDALLTRCKLPPSAVKTHQQINIVHTRCPGAKFPAQSFLDSLRPPGNGPRARK